MANKLIQDLGAGAFALTDLLEHQPLAGPPSLKGDVAALVTLLNTIYAPLGASTQVTHGSGPPVAAPTNPAIANLYYDDDNATESYGTIWPWSVTEQKWIGT